MSYNRVILQGNLTRDPEVRYLQSGAAVAQFGIATNRKFKVEGQEREEVCFVDVACFGKQAETIAQYCKKGKQLLVEGRLKLEQWDDKNSGQKRSKHIVVLESFSFCGGKETADKPQPTTRPAPTEPAPAGPDDDVPF